MILSIRDEAEGLPKSAVTGFSPYRIRASREGRFSTKPKLGESFVFGSIIAVMRGLFFAWRLDE